MLLLTSLPGRRVWLGHCLLLSVFFLVLGRAAAVERTLSIAAPAWVRVGDELSVILTAGTDAGQGEQVGFLQAESSVDGGKTWTAICYLVNGGERAVQRITLQPGPVGTTVKLRVRAAFRDGLAGDVDYSGAAIRWQESWGEWREPPAKLASIAVRMR